MDVVSRWLFLTRAGVLPMTLVAAAEAGLLAVFRRDPVNWWLYALASLGLVVTLGGVGIYFGAQMREAGDYPYTLALEDPHFMEASHWNPRYTPLVGHWHMLTRNVSEHLRGEAPVLGAKGTPDPRTGISPEEQRTLLHAIDVWWLYAGYAGLPRLPLFGAALLLTLACVWAWTRAWRIARAERHA